MSGLHGITIAFMEVISNKFCKLCTYHKWENSVRSSVWAQARELREGHRPPTTRHRPAHSGQGSREPLHRGCAICADHATDPERATESKPRLENQATPSATMSETFSLPVGPRKIRINDRYFLIFQVPLLRSSPAERHCA
jgi:hypothetical protein